MIRAVRLPAALVAICLGQNACIGPSSPTCSWGAVCPSGMKCHAPTEQCLFPSQMKDCAGRPDGEACSVPGRDIPYLCVDGLCMPSVCGDGVTDDRPAVGEVCDDGNTEPGDGCRADCLGIERCGDRLVDEAAGEECDDANLLPDDGCTRLCLFPFCGDGIVSAGEACDHGEANSDVVPGACRTDCRLPGCGDNVVDDGEAANCWLDRTDGNVSAGPLAQALAVSDLNGDGFDDVVVTSREANRVSVFLSLGIGGLSEAEGSPHAVGQDPTAVTLADFDRDGKMDMALVTGTGAISIRLGDGEGGFAGSSTLGVQGRLSDVKAADVDNDQFPDLLVADELNDRLMVWASAGDGTFVLTESLTVGATGYDPSALDAGDLNGDGWVDVAVANEGFHQISLFRGSETGFRMADGFPVPVGDAWNSLVRDVAIGDVNGDGNLDLVYVDTRYAGSSEIGVLVGNGDLTFQETSDASEVGTATIGIALADFDLDGRWDLAAPSTAEPEVYLLMGSADGTFYPASLLPLSVGVASRAAAVGDLNGDGWPDLVVADQRTGVLGVQLNLP